MVAWGAITLVTLGNLFNVNTRQYLYGLLFCESALYGIMSGYVSSRLYKFFNGTNWVLAFFTTAIMIPLLIFIVSIIIDVSDYFDRELRSIPSSERTNLISLWICWNFPCVAIGQLLGYKSAKIVAVVKPSRLHRPLPGLCQVPFYA